MCNPTKSASPATPITRKDVRTEHTPSPWPYMAAYIPMLVMIYGVAVGGWGYFYTPLFVFGVIPLLDLCVSTDDWNPSKEQASSLSQSKAFRYITYMQVPLQFISQCLAIHVVMTRYLSMTDFLGVVLSLGLVGGASINVAHELIHKPTILEQNLGWGLLTTVCYGHFYTEHLLGHHKRVSTPEDAASAPLGVSFYAFFLHSVIHTLRSAFEIERKRLTKLGRSVWSLQNCVVSSTLLSYGVYPAVIWLVTRSLLGVAVYFLAGFISIMILELINYIEHYGLSRKQVAEGRYEKITPMHSWNAGHRVTNYLLFKLQRHSDHHANAGRRYQVLRSFKAAPQLPTGYAGMMLLGMCPPLFFRIMDPCVAATLKRAAEYETAAIDPFADPSFQ